MPPMVIAASDQAPTSDWDPNAGPTRPYLGPNSPFWPGSPAARKAGENFIRNIQELIDGWVKWYNVTDAEKEACRKRYEDDEKQCYENHSYNPDALRGAGSVLRQFSISA